ncbi:hypothetical protein DSL72_005284 [Monilinia vaccinii-corymbosi]|uniref:Uncharacterized protein n=1 Tax=Monilinia vaccinii-corymbosi TaxID=61207 RepID=A0A8A3PF78_9HELO|nr:hypothetical protein DSL72_005284 [Monilinia vaccinii-corymbosi]
MSYTEMAPGLQAQAQTNGGMSQADVDFLMCCLRNTTGGSIQPFPIADGKQILKIDTQRVAQILNYKNPRSVSNKVSNIKKKYDLPFGASSRTAEDMASTKPANGDDEPAVPTTPSKNRVTKAKAIPRSRATKKTSAKKSKKAVSDDDEEDELTSLKEEDVQETKQEDSE